MWSAWHRLVLTAALLVHVLVQHSLCKDVILEPVKRAGPETALVIIQEFQISPKQYIPLATAIQNASNLTLWVGIPDFSFDFPAPFEVATGITRIVTAMREAGLESQSIAFAGHSIGGVSLQTYLHDNSTMGFAQILLGNFLQRKYRTRPYQVKVPTMTVGGELDGVCRVTRIMESYYHSILTAENQTLATIEFPVVVVEGMSNMQFASGSVPHFTKDLDLRPEISYDDAHLMVGSLVSAFLDLHMGYSKSLTVLVEAVKKTGVFLRPILNAFELEGYHYFKPPCNDDPPSSTCTIGSLWSQQALVVMAALKEVHINDSDSFHPSSEFYPHDYLPYVKNTCSSPSMCTLQVVSDTENVYDESDIVLDSGVYPISAKEMRIKMTSRQVLIEAAGYGNVDFTASDGYSVCKVINQASYNWSLRNASNHTRQRFMNYGVPYEMGNDEGPYNIYPEWMYYPLEYKQRKTAEGKSVVVVSSPTLRTPKDYYIKISAGFHFCKILSPARVMEWIYVDGLRENYGIKNQTII